MNFIDMNESLKPSSTCYYLVVQIDQVWWIDVEGKPFGPCQDQEDAISSALRLIKMFGDTSRQAAVYAPGDDGRSQLVWRGFPSDV